MTHKFCGFSAFALRFSSLAVATMLLLPGIAQAQLKVSPLVIEAQANRSQAQGMITVSNPTTTPVRVRLYAKPFTYSENEGFQTVATNPNDLTPYLRFSPRELTIPGSTSRRVRLFAQLPPKAAEGEYRAVIFAETLTESRDTQGNQINLVARVGVTTYIRQGNLSPSLSVESASFNTEQNRIQLAIRNTGTASARPAVAWVLKQGNTVIQKGNVESSSIITQSRRNLVLDYPQAKLPLPAPGQYQLSGELTWEEGTATRQLPFTVNLSIPTGISAPKERQGAPDPQSRPPNARPGQPNPQQGSSGQPIPPASRP